MLKAFLVVSLSVLMVCVPVAPAATPSAVGQIITRGRAEINGIPAPPQATVFAGDRIVTQKNTTASLNLAGGNHVLLPAFSAAAVQRNASETVVSLEHGSVAVLSKSDSPVVIQANGARIRPAAKATAVFEVAVHGNALEVLARRGSAMVETANKSVEVKEGTELEASMAPPQQGGMGLSSLATWTIALSTAAGITGLALGAAAFSRSAPQDCTVSPSSLNIVCP